jgi:hypothetical protein
MTKKTKDLSKSLKCKSYQKFKGVKMNLYQKEIVGDYNPWSKLSLGFGSCIVY